MKRKHKGRADIWIRVIALIATLATIGAVAYVQFSGTDSKLEEAVTNLESGITTPSDSGTEPAPSDDAEEASSSYSGFFPIIDESNPVDKSYFEDAVFIGDSLLNGLKLNTEIGTVADWLVNDDMTVGSAKRISISTPSGSTTLMDALAAKKYAKVYVMMGINDLTAPAKDWASQRLSPTPSCTSWPSCLPANRPLHGENPWVFRTSSHTTRHCSKSCGPTVTITWIHGDSLPISTAIWHLKTTPTASI